MRARIGVAWFEDAACRGMDPEMWFPPRGTTSVEALRVCEGCPVRYECLVWGLDERLGIWGGRHDRWRRRLRRRMRTEGLGVLAEDAERPVLDRKRFCIGCRCVVDDVSHRCGSVA